MRVAALLVFALVGALLATGLSPSTSAQGSGVRYELHLQCPSEPATFSFQIPPRTDTGCPIRAVDGGDLMGDPSLAVDPLRPENLIIGSLHGQNYPGEGPDAKSRQGQVFTTFTSQDAGAYWIDNPYVPPEEIEDAYGQHPQVTIDPYGHVFVGSLYAVPQGSRFDYVIGAQKFENIDTINEEQTDSDGGYHVDYITPVHNQSRIHQMWFLFNPATDNMTMVWHESPAGVVQPPPCDDEEGVLVAAAGVYVLPRGQNPEIWQETNGKAGLQTSTTCPGDPDSWIFAATSLDAVRDRFGFPPAATPSSSPATVAPPAAGLKPAGAVQAAPRFAMGGLPVAPATTTTPPVDASSMVIRKATEGPDSLQAWVRSLPSAPKAVAATDNATANATAPGVIGLVWTTADTDTPYLRQNATRVIGPCSASTNPVLSFGLLYIGCVADPAAGEFRWRPETEAGTVELFRLHPDGGEPEYMGAAPPMPGTPRLGVRSDGRLALVSAGAADGGLLFGAAFGRYEPADQRIVWSRQLSLGSAILPVDDAQRVQAGAIQDVIYREQSGALHVILKTTIDHTAEGTLDRLGLPAPNIRKDIIALDEEYGLLAHVPLDIGDPLVRSQDSTIMGAAEAVFQDISDDFLQLPPGPFTYAGKDLGADYQREFFAIADYGTVLFAELVEVTELRAPGLAPPPIPPPAVTAPATTGLLAPVAGLTATGLLALSMAAHRRKNPLASFTKGD